MKNEPRIIHPNPSVWGDSRLFDAERERLREMEAAIQQDGYILIIWALWGCRPFDIISAWYLPKDGKKWVYKWEYNAKTMKQADSYSRSPCHELYEWFKEGLGIGMYRECHVCAPMYLLLDNSELRQEYLSGGLEKTS